MLARTHTIPHYPPLPLSLDPTQISIPITNSLSQVTRQIPRDIGIKPRQLLFKDAPIVLESYLVYLALTRQLKEPGLEESHHEGTHSNPNEDVSKYIYSIDEEVIWEASGAITHCKSEHIFEGKVGACEV